MFKVTIVISWETSHMCLTVLEDNCHWVLLLPLLRYKWAKTSYLTTTSTMSSCLYTLVQIDVCSFVRVSVQASKLGHTGGPVQEHWDLLNDLEGTCQIHGSQVGRHGIVSRLSSAHAVVTVSLSSGIMSSGRMSVSAQWHRTLPRCGRQHLAML